MPTFGDGSAPASIRPASVADMMFVQRMLAFAAHWRVIEPPPLAEVLADPHNAIYVADWGRPGDTGFVAEVDGLAAGAAWYRLFTADQAGYGFIDEITPEVTIAVEPRFRRRGLATLLLDHLGDAAIADGHSALSLSVERDNPAARVYRRGGYETVGENGGSWTMRKLLSPRSAHPAGV